MGRCSVLEPLPISAIFLPLLITIILYFSSAMTHLGLVILRGNNERFQSHAKVNGLRLRATTVLCDPRVGSISP